MILTIVGLNNYDSKLFDNFKIPDGVDKQILIDTILMECGNLELIYPSATMMKYAIESWSKKQLKTWNSLNETFYLDYNPIWNVDGTETEERTLTGTNTRKGDYDTNIDSKNTNTESVTGYNSNAFQNANRNVIDGNSKTDSTENINDSKNEKEVLTKTRGGNIGVTTTQKMLNEELEIRPKLNIYDYICNDFKNRFCLLVY